MNQKQKCVILSLCLRIASPRKPWEFYLSCITAGGRGDLKGKAEISLNSFIQAGSLSAVLDYIVSQCAYRFNLYLHCIAGIHRANAVGGASSDNITRQQGHYMRYEVYQLRDGVDKVVSVALLFEFPI